ncbi:MAG TPA: methyltransferase domain-containing protein [Bryobacteraceae bacterium]
MPFDSRRRILSPEALDHEAAAAVAPEMRDLVRINRWLGGRAVLPRLFRPFADPRDAFTVLDTGAGSGDIATILSSKYPHAVVTSLDRRPEFLLAAPSPRVAADAFHLPFAARTFDFVTCSLFLHHFPDERVVPLIAALRNIARRALIVVDLERHRLAYHFIPATRPLFGWHALTMRDARISVQSGFRPVELAALARAAGAGEWTVRRHRPWFRLSLVVPAG